MRIAQVIGAVTLNRQHPSFTGASFRLAVPLSLDELAGNSPPSAEAIVVYDALGSGVGDRIAISEGREAAQPFYPEEKAVDAYNAAILDTVVVETSLVPAGITKTRKSETTKGIKPSEGVD
jgi:microcompartment protein CcmK/EutM